MSKKNFKGINPALQFINTSSHTDNTSNTDNVSNANNTDVLSNNANTVNTDKTRNKTVSKILNSDNRERKSKRLNLLLKPSIAENLMKIATMKQTSPNDLINSVLEEYNNREFETIIKYDSVFN